MKFTSETKFFLGIIGITLLILFAAITIMSKPSKPLTKEALIPDSAPTRGNKNANVWLVEFSDFQCPACKLFANVVDDLAKAYPDTLFIAYRHFPLPQHPFAKKAAIAAEAAGKQGKFWDMDRLLFTNQETLSETKVVELATSLNLDMTAFASGSGDSTIQSKIDMDVAYGNSIGINATPTFYLNGMKLELASPNDLKTKVEEMITKSQNTMTKSQ